MIARVAFVVAAAVGLATSQSTQPPASPPPQKQTPSFRAGVDLVSLNVTVTDGTSRYVTDLAQDDFNVFEDGVQAGRHLLQPDESADRAGAAARHEREHGTKLPTAQEAAIGFAQAVCVARTSPKSSTSTAASIVLQNFTNNAAELEQAIRKTSAGGSTSLYNAVYIALKDLKKVVAKNVDEIRRQAIVVLSDGEDTSSLLPFEEVLDLAKRSETAIYAIGLRTPDGPGGRPDAASRKPSSSCGSSRRKPAAARSSRDQLADLADVYGQISDELSSQYTVGYTSRNPKRDGSWRRVVVRVNRPSLTARTKQGYFAPDVADHEFDPPVFYAAALVAYAWHFAQRQPDGRPFGDDAAGRRGARHTFVIGMQTMEAGHVPVAGATSAISTFVWLLALAYLYTEMTTDERAMGVFILPLLVALQAIPALRPGVEARSPVLQGPLFGIHVSSLLFAYASFALACVHRHHLRAAVQGDQGEAPRVFLRAPAVAAGARPHEPARDRDRLDFPDPRHHRRRRLGGAGAAHADPRVQAMSLQDPKIFVALVCWAVYSFELFAARRIGWGGRRAAYLSAVGFAIVLLNFVPISYFLTKSHNF